jgi:TetR/AcrR family transcriptional regulator
VSLTKQLVKPGRRLRRRPAPAADASRDRLLQAAAQEFAGRGFAGTGVDRVAARARLNKAMIYYHFGSKAGLYREILRDMFAAVGARVAAVSTSEATPADKMRQFVEAIAIEAEARPHFPPIWFREIAEGGQHLDDETIGAMAGVLKALSSIMAQGVEAKQFRPLNPLLLHAGIVAPLLLYFASAGIRQRIARSGVRAASQIHRDEVVAHVQRVALSLLEGRA